MRYSLNAGFQLHPDKNSAGQRPDVGETVFSTHDIHHNDNTFSVREMKKENPNFPALQQAGVRYRWDGEETYGMLERSSPIEKIEF